MILKLHLGNYLQEYQHPSKWSSTNQSVRQTNINTCRVQALDKAEYQFESLI